MAWFRPLLCALILMPSSHALGQGTDSASVWRAASRLGYAPTPAIVQAIQQHPQGARGWALDQIELAYRSSQEPPNVPESLASFAQPLPLLAEAYRRERQAQAMVQSNATGEQFSRQVNQDSAAWRLLMCSKPELEPPLLARLTEFWFNHFNVFSGKGSVRPFIGHYVAYAIRPNSVGHFETLLLSSARHPAMLFYLDQAQSVAEGLSGIPGQIRGLNENYARELMELHTVGVNAGYSQNDIRELARILTGWTVDPRASDGFRFAPGRHDQGSKTVLGRTFGAKGEAEGREVMTLLARHPATAQRIALRLAQWFVSDDPPTDLVQELSNTFQRSNGDIRAMMRTVVNSDAFWSTGNTLFKTPYDYACSVLTVTQNSEIGPVLRYLSIVGQPIHAWQTPDGYNTSAATWLSPEALTRRADLAYAVTNNASNVEYLQDFLKLETRSRIPHVPARTRALLTLSSPDFMKK
ncbi:MAG: DUF1800 family protein [Burkholderiales bacterium]|jgi:uncharacterized protein (DUF1800 family)|nr:DUF1800 domain-containing protein [Burkholderiales bacterium]